MGRNCYSRRTFLKALGIGAAALTLPGCDLLQKEGTTSKIGVQLYSVRKAIEKDFEGTMKKIADLGFEGVETYFLPENISLHRAKKVFDDTGLKVLGMHCELPTGDQRDTALRMADVYNCERLIYAGWPQGEKYSNLDATKHTADVYNEISSFLKTKGLRFGLHNHWWEFELTDGIYPFYYLLEHLDKEIFFEIDVYWAKTGGRDPAKVVYDFADRAPLLHIKDGPAIKGDIAYEQVPAGEGVIDFPAILKAGGKNIEWMIIEFDEYAGDIFQGIQRSNTFLIKQI